MAFDLEIKGNTYRIGKLSAMAQFHVSRKVAPLLPPLVALWEQALKAEKPLQDSLTEIAEFSVPFLDGLSKLPDEQLEYVIAECMAVVTRREGSASFPVWSAAARAPMYEDIDMAVMLQLTARVIADSLGPFIDGWLISPESHPQTTATDGQVSRAAKTGFWHQLSQVFAGSSH
ncbi:phage tail assembly chaperone [Pandoraea sp. CB10b_02]|uniref:phage tail assembly chaperone n=1 Tax=Pandoraea sp. CB10b_02 TaxID=2014535 RepID=UPI00257AA821|nr:hypothetical protein [Pandoraea sp. CB10b_02]